MKMEEQQCSMWVPERDPTSHTTALSWAFQCKRPFPSQSTPKLGRLDLQGFGERQAEEEHISHQLCSQECSPHQSPKEHNQKVMHTLLLPFIHTPNDVQGHFITQHLSPGLYAQTTALPVPLPGRAWGVFFSFPPLSFLARGQPAPWNRLQDRYCRVLRSVTWLEERMKSEMKPHSFLFLKPC